MSQQEPRGLRRLLHLPSTHARLEADIEAEFRFHMDERIQELVASGLSRNQAEIEVQRRFGDIASYRRSVAAIDANAQRRAQWRDRTQLLIVEFGQATRALARAPSFTVVAIFTLALGLGGATALFTVLDSVLLRSLPYQQPERLVSVLHPATVPGSGERTWGLSTGGYFHFRQHAKTLADLGMYRAYSMAVTGAHDAEMAHVAQVTASLFPVLRARAYLGRLIGEDDDQPDSARVVVLGHAFWQRRFGADPRIIGRSIATAEGNFEVIGVAPPGLTLPLPGPFSDAASIIGTPVDLWIPLKANPAGPHYNSHPYVGLARLASGSDEAAAQREISALTLQLPEVAPNAYSTRFLEQYSFRASVTLLHRAVLGPTLPRTLWLLFGAVLLVLCIAAANVAGLLIARHEARRREVAIRTALGAGRGHLVTHHLAEALVLGGGAAALGILLSVVGVRALIAIAPDGIPRLESATMGAGAVSFALSVALAITVAFGLAPAMRNGRASGALREEGRSSTGTRERARARNVLVTVQIALSVLLLAGAGLLLRSVGLLQQVQPGFATRGILAFNVSLPFTQYDTREKSLAFHRALADRLRALPEVLGVGSASALPLEGFGAGCTVVFRPGRPYANGEETPCVSTPVALPGFLATLGVTVRGRIPDWRDVDARRQTAVVTEALAARLWPGENPIGQGINSNGPSSTNRHEVVGVIPTLLAEALDRPPTEAVFYSGTPAEPNVPSRRLNELVVALRVAGDPLSLLPNVRRVLSDLDPRVPLDDPRSMDQITARSMSRITFVTRLLATAAVVAVVLSLVGTYGLMAYLVTQRRGEMGVRLALGASPASITGLVVRGALRLGLVGAAIGLASALAAGRVLDSLLYGVRPTDPEVLLLAALVLVVLSSIAGFLPARRAAATPPGEVLRG